MACFLGEGTHIELAAKSHRPTIADWPAWRLFVAEGQRGSAESQFMLSLF
jgi:hypothetical protein